MAGLFVVHLVGSPPLSTPLQTGSSAPFSPLLSLRLSSPPCGGDAGEKPLVIFDLHTAVTPRRHAAPSPGSGCSGRGADVIGAWGPPGVWEDSPGCQEGRRGVRKRAPRGEGEHRLRGLMNVGRHLCVDKTRKSVCLSDFGRFWSGLTLVIDNN